MQVITVASYYGSGSSAVTDLLSEFSEVKAMTDYEFRFAQDPDGLSELEYNLVENFNRHNSGHALKRYKALVDYYGNHFMVKRYEPFFGNQWKKISYDYIDSLTDFTYPGMWQYDFYDKGPWYEFWHKLPDRILRRTFWKNKPDKHWLLGDSVTLASHPTEKKFLECTKNYTDKLMQAANPENLPFLMMDQLMPSSNISRHLRYFNNLKVFVVDRDPRDIYLLGKYAWNDRTVPRDINIFCKWYRYTRSTRGVEYWDPDKIYFVQFEDMIYRYDETCTGIQAWAGLEQEKHTAPKLHFDPSVSIKNTRYWITHPEYKKEAEEIARQLPEFLYKIPGGTE